MRAVLCLAVVMTALACCSPALAQDAPPEEVEIGQMIADNQGTHFTLEVTCTTPAPGHTSCPASAQVSWQVTPRAKWSPSGTAHVVDTQAVDIATGAKQTLTFDVDPAKLRDPVAKLGRKRASIVSIELTAPDGSSLGGGGAFVAPVPMVSGCGAPNFVPLDSGSLLEEITVDGKRTTAPLHSPDVGRNTTYGVTETASFAFNG